MMRTRIALLDDEPRMVEVLAMVLDAPDRDIVTYTDPRVLVADLEAEDFDLLVTDSRMPHLDGHAVLAAARDAVPELPVVFLTAHGTVETAMAAVRAGAADFLEKPFDNDVCRAQIAAVLDAHRRRREHRYLRAQHRDHTLISEAVVASDAMRRVFSLARRAARSRATVLVTGESGTGKELVARAVHYFSARVDGPFVALNCRAVAPTLLDSELFGHDKGAFTGAERARAGLFEQADGGTLFLDEIGDVSAEFQARLLRVLQEREVRRVGSTQVRSVDVRVVAASQQDLLAEVAAGRFREDLYYRLAVVPIPLPPLRERVEDVLPLAHHFLARYARELRSDIRGWTAEVEAWLLTHDWPGNVRELDNLMERAVALAEGEEIALDDLLLPPDAPRAGATLAEALEVATTRHLRAVLAECGGVKAEAARRLGIDRTTLFRLLKRHDLG
jgi:DNA-binding NtrC family response regulator